MKTHNLNDEIEQIQRILSSPLKKIGFLFGAGVSMKRLGRRKLIEARKVLDSHVPEPNQGYIYCNYFRNAKTYD